MRVGVLSPGSMGSAVGRRLLAGGAQVRTCVAGRSPRTRERAREAGMEESPDYASLVRDSDVVLSIVAPAEAEALAVEVAGAVRESGVGILYADCNAVAPSTVRRIAAVVEAAGAGFVDACIIGGPPREGTTTKFYASGPRAGEFARLRDAGLDVRSVGDDIGRASALKMSYAAITKGTTALATQMLLAAHASGVYEALKEELADSLPDLLRLIEGWLPPMPAKSRRWVGEMQELERTFTEAGLPGGSFAGIAALYEWVGARGPGEDSTGSGGEVGTMDAVVDALARRLQGPDTPPEGV